MGGLEASEKAAFEECFVDIPDCLETASIEGEESTDGGAESVIMDVDSLLQPDYSGYTFWSNDTMPSESQGAAEIWKTGAGVFLPPTSSGQSFLSSLVRRQSDESMQSSFVSGHAPFKSGYCRSESGLFAESSQVGEPMQFVPSTSAYSAEGGEKVQGADGKAKKRVYKRKSSEAEQTSPPYKAPKKLKINIDERKKGLAEEGPVSGVKKNKGQKRTELELLRLSTAAMSGISVKKENQETLLETPTSTVSDLPIASRRERGTKLAGTAESRDKEQTVLKQSSPNLPRRLTNSRIQKLQKSTASEGSQKKVKANSVQKNLADEADSLRLSKFSDKKTLAKIEPESNEQVKKAPVVQRPRKAQGRVLLPEESLQVLKDWAKSSSVVPYPDKETKQKLAEDSHLTVYQVDNWLAGARNRTHLIKVPRKLKLMSKGPRGKAGSVAIELEDD